MTKALCSKASQVANAANNLPKPSQIHSKSTQTHCLQTGISLLSSQAPLVAPTGASAPSHGPWERIPEMISNTKNTMKQVQEGKTRELLNFLQFALKPRIETYLQARVLTGANRRAPTCDWAELWAPTCCSWVTNISVQHRELSGGTQLSEMHLLLQG